MEFNEFAIRVLSDERYKVRNREPKDDAQSFLDSVKRQGDNSDAIKVSNEDIVNWLGEIYNVLTDIRSALLEIKEAMPIDE